jgi:hypothetical protein
MSGDQETLIVNGNNSLLYEVGPASPMFIPNSKSEDGYKFIYPEDPPQ